MVNNDKELTELRQAIFASQWQERVQILCNLFATNVPQATRLVTDEMVLSSLRFQEYFDVKWVTEFAQKITHFIETHSGSSEASIPALPVELGADYSDDPPGVPEFKGGIETLWQSLSVVHRPHENGEAWILPYSIETHLHHKKPEKVGLLATALTHFVTGEKSHYWSHSYPEEWQLFQIFHKSERDKNGSPILPEGIDRAKLFRGVRLHQEPESIGYEVAKWLRIADEIEIRFK
jgi:hypothetical protein